jgi:hypothetical protein
VNRAGAIENAPVVMLRAFLLAVACLLISPLALAQTVTPYPPPPAANPPPPNSYPPPTNYAPPPPGWVPAPPPEPPHPRRVFSLTISPIHLLLPVVELTGEARVHDQVGLAFIGGVGRYTDKNLGVSASVYEAGGQLRFYVLGDFRHGMQVGAEALYLHLSDPNLSATGEGLAAGPFLGYKVMTDAGFTFDTQLGFEHLFVRGASGSSTSSGETNIVLLNANIGWSF